MGLTGIERKSYAAGLLVHPVEATIENFKAEISIDQKVLRRGLISGEIGHVRRLSPYSRCVVRLLAGNQLADVFEQTKAPDGLLQRIHLLPNSVGRSFLMSCVQEVQERFIGVRSDDVVEQKLRIRM